MESGMTNGTIQSQTMDILSEKPPVFDIGSLKMAALALQALVAFKQSLGVPIYTYRWLALGRTAPLFFVI